MPDVRNSSNLTVNIREMIETDLDAVVALENVIFPDPWAFQAFTVMLSKSDWHSLIAELDSVIVGYACYQVVDIEVHLANIAVSEPYRRKSVAKKLMEHILQVVSNLKCEYIMLEVRSGNTQAIAFYEKYNFRQMYRSHDYYHNPVEDALVMMYNLRSVEKSD